MNKSDNINELATALSKAQKEIKGAITDSTNPFFKTEYADLASVWEAIRDPLTKNGLSVSQLTNQTEHGQVVETLLMHSSGQWIMGSLLIKSEKDNSQGMGAGITYARRFALSAIAGVAQIDDDGETAVGRAPSVPPEVKSVEKVKSAPIAPVSQSECEHKWYASKYKENEDYCAKCKEKRQRKAG